jgi:hypothetical protein
MLVGLIFIGVAALVVLICGGIAIVMFLRTAATAGWQPAPGQVLESRVVHSSTTEGTSSDPRVVYAYLVAGRQYQGERIFVGGAVSGWGADKTVARYPVGSAVQVFYNPANPAEAVLERRSPVGIYLVLFAILLGGIFFSVGAGLVVFNLP